MQTSAGTIPRLGVILASTRPGRVGAPVADWVMARTSARDEFEVELIDLADPALPLLDEPNHPRLAQYTHEHTKAWSATVAAQDAFVLVMPEYNHGYTAPLKNALDYVFNEWANKPVGFVSYGGVAGGTRAVQLLKPVVSCLGMYALTAAVAIPFVHTHLDDDRRFVSNQQLDESLNAVVVELKKYADALRPLRSVG